MTLAWAKITWTPAQSGRLFTDAYGNGHNVIYANYATANARYNFPASPRCRVPVPSRIMITAEARKGPEYPLPFIHSPTAMSKTRVESDDDLDDLDGAYVFA